MDNEFRLSTCPRTRSNQVKREPYPGQRDLGVCFIEGKSFDDVFGTDGTKLGLGLNDIRQVIFCSKTYQKLKSAARCKSRFWSLLNYLELGHRDPGELCQA